MRNLTKAVLLAACLALVASSAAAAELPKPGDYVIKSHPQFRVTVGDAEEMVYCDATLVLRTTEPFATGANTQRINMQVVSWEASGTSELLGGKLEFRMIPGSVDEESYIETKDANNFPAHGQFAIRYELETPFGVMTDLTGVTWGTLNSFPPAKGDTMQLRKGQKDLIAHLLPAPLSAMSAAGMVMLQSASVEAVACLDDDILQ